MTLSSFQSALFSNKSKTSETCLETTIPWVLRGYYSTAITVAGMLMRNVTDQLKKDGLVTAGVGVSLFVSAALLMIWYCESMMAADKSERAYYKSRR